MLMEYLLIHLVDCHVLFNDKHTGNTKKSSGHTKKDIQAVITKIIFEHDSAYAEAYQATPDKFQQSGKGIVPSHPKYSNLLEIVNAKFPYYNDLHSLWEGNPSYNPDLVSSKPKKNHAEDFLSLVKMKKAATTTSVTAIPTDNAAEVDEDPESDAPVGGDDGEEPEDGFGGTPDIHMDEEEEENEVQSEAAEDKGGGDEDQDDFEIDSGSVHQEQPDGAPV
ncbi:hypothetical protein BU15DRAFT_68731 [Melanogaster broomeanus]|nr:hypothetical protein BU15DRAFT_68731 [Melanogaster broomeanus]